MSKDKAALGLGQEEFKTLGIEELVPILISNTPSQIQQLHALVEGENFKKYLLVFREINRENETDNPLKALEHFILNGD